VKLLVKDKVVEVEGSHWACGPCCHAFHRWCELFNERRPWEGDTWGRVDECYQAEERAKRRRSQRRRALKGLSVRQPWAFAIVHLGKRIENRSRAWHYRGPVAIHASKIRLLKSGLLPCAERWELEDGARAIQEILRHQGQPPPDGIGMTYQRMIDESGAIVGAARIVDCVTKSDSPWFTGPFGLVLEDVRPTPVIFCKGALGLWTVPADVEARIR